LRCLHFTRDAAEVTRQSLRKLNSQCGPVSLRHITFHLLAPLPATGYGLQATGYRPKAVHAVKSSPVPHPPQPIEITRSSPRARFAYNFPLSAHTVSISTEEGTYAAAHTRRVRILGQRSAPRNRARHNPFAATILSRTTSFEGHCCDARGSTGRV